MGIGLAKASSNKRASDGRKVIGKRGRIQPPHLLRYEGGTHLGAALRKGSPKPGDGKPSLSARLEARENRYSHRNPCNEVSSFAGASSPLSLYRFIVGLLSRLRDSVAIRVRQRIHKVGIDGPLLGYHFPESPWNGNHARLISGHSFESPTIALDCCGSLGERLRYFEETQ